MRGAWLKKRVMARVLVHTVGKNTYDGVLAEVARDGLVLRAASFLEDQATVKMAGETFIPREQIAFVQVAEPKPPS